MISVLCACLTLLYVECSSDGFDLHFHSFGNENKGVAAVETGGQQHATGMLHLSGFEAIHRNKKWELPQGNSHFLVGV